MYRPTEHTDGSWDVVNIDKLGGTGHKDYKDYTSEAPYLTIRPRRARTEGRARRSMFGMRSRSDTMSNASTGQAISPATSTQSEDLHRDDMEVSRPQSGWSDSDQSDRQTKSWVAKGSKILKKQNSKFNLSSSRRSSWFDESDKVGARYSKTHVRGSKQDEKIRPSSSGRPARPMISEPFDFRHLTHTQAHQLAYLRNASQQKLATGFSAIRASQAPQPVLQGIRTEALRLPASDASSPRYQNPVSPPALSPTKPSTPRSKNGLSIDTRRGRLSLARSIDNFSQPSPKAYRMPRSPPTPPPKPSRHITPTVPEFFSDIHHATACEREILSRCASAELPGPVQSPAEAATPCEPEQEFYNENLPHAITTSEEIALTLKPSTTRRSALALADVPEEDELYPIRRVSEQSLRPATGDPALRHATTFPSNNCPPRCRRSSSSQAPLSLSDVMPAPRSTSGLPATRPDDNNEVDASPRRDDSPDVLPDATGVDACWEDDIDYCYQLEAEADCDFDWDRLSMDRTLSTDKPRGREASLGVYQDRSESLSRSKTYEKLDTRKAGPCLADAKSSHNSSSHHLPPLQTCLPDLDFSAASSAKSSIASLGGPITPLQLLPSSRKVNLTLQSSKSTDTLNLESSFQASAECGIPWSQEDSFHKVPSWDHASHFNYPFNNLSLSGSSKAASQRSSRPSLSMHQSSDGLVLSHSASAGQTRRNTSSSNGFPELVCRKPHRQQANMVTEQIADRSTALAVTDRPADTKGDTSLAKSGPSTSDDATRAFASNNHPPHLSNHSSRSLEDDAVLVMLPSSKAPDPAISVTSFVDRLRSNSNTSSTSGSSSVRSSKVSYSLFPLPPAKTPTR
ncbi:MAG: hypothetical protein Q9196_002414 [Gyalolechia fulgens]